MCFRASNAKTVPKCSSAKSSARLTKFFLWEVEQHKQQTTTISSCAFGLPEEACGQVCGRDSRPSPAWSSRRPLPTARSPRPPCGPLSDGESFLVDEGRSHFRLTLFGGAPRRAFRCLLWSIRRQRFPSASPRTGMPRFSFYIRSLGTFCSVSCICTRCGLQRSPCFLKQKTLEVRTYLCY